MLNRYFLILIAITLVIAIMGCSKTDTPINQPNPTGEISFYDNLPAAITDSTENGNVSGGMGFLGLFQMHLDPLNLTGELTSLRNGSLEDVLEVVDITNFIQLAPCIDCAKIKSIALDSDNHLVVSIGIKHPFPAGDPFKPTSGKNRADLHVFNVEGVLLSNASGTTFPGLGNTVAGFNLLNADGYTSYLDSSLDAIYPTDASIHPYITHFDDYSAGNFNPSSPTGFESVTNPPPSGNLVMPMGCDYNFQDYVIDTPLNNSVDLLFAIECTYAVSAANKSMRFTPEYRVPQHNKKAASEVHVEIVSNDLADSDTTSTATLQVKVVDINNGVAVGTALNEMRADSSVSAVAVEIPGVTSGPVTFPTTPLSGTGHSPADPLVYEGVVTNTASATQGFYTGLVKVTDSYVPGQNISPLLGGQDGIKRVSPIDNPLTGLYTIDEFATYQVFSIAVTQAQGLVCSLVIDPGSPTMPFEGWGGFTFDASGSYDPLGNPLTFEWDFNNDGIFGDTYNRGPSDKPIKVFDFTNQEQVCVKISNGLGPEATCCVDVDIIGVPTKNIPLRTGVEAKDIAIDHNNGDLWVLYTDKSLWKYPRNTFYQSGSKLWDTWAATTSLSFLEISPNQHSIVSGTYASGNSVVQVFDPAGIMLYAMSQGGPGYPTVEVFALTSGVFQNHLGNIFGWVPNNATFAIRYPDGDWFYGHQWHYYWPTVYTGVDQIYYGYIKGVESDANGNFLWYLEGAPEYYAARWKLSTAGFPYDQTYDNAYMGIGSATDLDNGFNDPRDITRDNLNRYFVLDKLSTAEPRVKAWTVDGNTTTSIGSFGDTATINYEPMRIEGSDFEGNIVVLHRNASNDGYVSVFLPEEMPE